MPTRKVKWKARINRVREILSENFPEAFKQNGKDKTPLKVGIHKDIRAVMPELSYKEVRVALWDYTGGYKYLRNEVEGAARVDLNGEPCGVVDALQAQYGKERISRLQKGWESSKRQHDQATRTTTTTVCRDVGVDQAGRSLQADLSSTSTPHST